MEYSFMRHEGLVGVEGGHCVMFSVLIGVGGVYTSIDTSPFLLWTKSFQ